MLLSLVVPCYNEEQALPLFMEAVAAVRGKIDASLEFCFVDDGSTDGTLALLRELCRKHPEEDIHYVSFSRNFGKEAALYAGLEMAKGDYVVTMDADLQDPPSLLPEMWGILTDGTQAYDCVATRRTDRRSEPPIRSFFARAFYRIINRLSSTEIVDGARDFRMMSRQMVEAVLADREYNRFSKGIFSWVGFHTKWLSYQNVERSAGASKWSFWKLFRYAVQGILAYTTIPLYLSSFLGIMLSGISFLALCLIIVRANLWGDPVAGWPSLVCILTFLGGLILLSLGIIGLYIAKIYLETKKRQIYIVREQQ